MVRGPVAVFSGDGDVDASAEERLDDDVVSAGGFHGDLERLGARDAVAVDDDGLDAAFLDDGVDLFGGAEDEDDANAEGLQERDVLDDALENLGLGHDGSGDDDHHHAALVGDDVGGRLAEEVDERLGTQAVHVHALLAGAAVLPGYHGGLRARRGEGSGQRRGNRRGFRDASATRANAGGRGKRRAVGRGRTARRPPNAETETVARDARPLARDARPPARDARGRSSRRGAVPTTARTRALARAAMPDIHPRARVADDRGTQEALAGRAPYVARACAEDARDVMSHVKRRQRAARARHQRRWTADDDLSRLTRAR